MLFDLRWDQGARIAVYLVPDSGGGVPTIRVRSGGRELLALSANETIAALVEAGRHATGTCGFVIDDSLIADLAGYVDLEIVEAETGLLIYRRPPPAAIAGLRLFRLETHLLPLWRIDDAVKHRFHYWCKGIDRFGRETSTQVFCLKDPGSSYVSGRLFYKNYEFYLSKGVTTIAMLRDPYDELAERLIILKNMGERAEDLLGARDTLIFTPIVDCLAAYDAFDEKFCKAFFKRSSAPVLTALSNPLVRQLTASTPDEMPGRASVPSALEVLSSFAFIGLRSEGEDFCHSLAETLGLKDDSLPEIAEYSRIIELGELLRARREVEAFLEKDLEVFGLLSSAVETARHAAGGIAG